MSWFFSMVRIVGSSFPVASSFVQLQAEINEKQINDRIQKLEDPISSLHPDIQAISKSIFYKICETNSDHIKFENEFYSQNSRVLAVLKKNNLIKGVYEHGRTLPLALHINNPFYIIYLCKLYADQDTMERLFKTVDSCHKGNSLYTNEVKKVVDLPVPVIKSFFKIFEAKGYGKYEAGIGGHSRF